jgi:threonine dehydrogenase-like Zn-dependent dehydrogenase
VRHDGSVEGLPRNRHFELSVAAGAQDEATRTSGFRTDGSRRAAVSASSLDSSENRASTSPSRSIALISSGAIDLEGLVDARFSLESSEEALTSARRDPSLLKPLVRVAAS